MSVAEMFQSPSPVGLSAVDDPFDTPPLEVTVTVDNLGHILVSLPLVPVPQNYIGKILWTTTGTTTFDDPGIVFAGPAPFVVGKQDDQHYFAFVNNNNPNQRGSFPYTINAGGLTSDPVVQNDPPPD